MNIMNVRKGDIFEKNNIRYVVIDYDYLSVYLIKLSYNIPYAILPFKKIIKVSYNTLIRKYHKE